MNDVMEHQGHLTGCWVLDSYPLYRGRNGVTDPRFDEVRGDEREHRKRVRAR